MILRSTSVLKQLLKIQRTADVYIDIQSTEVHFISMYMCLLRQNQLLCQQAAILAMQLGHISIDVPSLIRIERGLEGEPRPRT